ncbi:MAG TPA: SDR family NAD(P)-dependent oxidoreductase, partial [Solirubrobacterales bacterium]|nr:SDR family NAD(P)-dependent oxidoreductase [Solirubrobacterales bacterium]
MLEDRVIAIAGAGGGLGPVVAERLAAEGAAVAATDRSQDALDALGSDLGLPPGRWDGRAVDLLD